MPAGRAKDIARAFLPNLPIGNRYDYYYVGAKLRSDPLYPGVLHALRGTTAPVLDLGCGLGLLAHTLRQDGQSQVYRGVDNDSAKILRAGRVATKAGLRDTHFEVVDLANTLPTHTGSVAILDVLQYLDAESQRGLLHAVARMLEGDARLVMRAALDGGGRRSRTTRITDRLANLIGWMGSRPRHYPTREGLEAILGEAGLRTEFRPLYGNTPFNHWLIVAQR
ncbi:MAG: methyltransferase domain-containing protein [Xanthomonadaceae bacterium]|nr:methyltransferase domain-containing protein [Xanthomonadaceae bacterium]